MSDIEVGDFVRYNNQKMTHKVVRIAGRVFYLRSGNYDRQSWAYREDLTLFQKHDFRENAV